MTTQQAFALALQHHQAGRLAEAEALYRQILAVQPEHAGALHHLGVVAHQVGRHDLAVEWIRQALAHDRDNPGAHANLGEAYRALNRLDEAMAEYRRAIQIKPNYPEAHNNLGIILARSGQLDEAIAAYRMVVQIDPVNPEGHNNLGITLARNGQFDEAVAAYRRAVELRPNYPDAYYNQGIALAELGRIDEAVAAYRRALQLKPDWPEAQNNLGIALGRMGQSGEAIAAYGRAIELRPDYAEAYYNLGIAQAGDGQFDQAIAAYRRTLELKPDYAEACNNLGGALAMQGQLVEAMAAYRRALELKPDYPEAHNNLGNAFKDHGRLDEAIAEYRQAARLQPGHSRMHSNLVYTLQFHPAEDDRTIAEEHQRWNRKFAEPLKPLLLPHANDRSPDRRLRVGYVSPDFRFQAEVFFVMPLLEAHDHQQFEIHGYASVARPDYLTERLRRSADVWHDVLDLSDHDLAQQIREDGIDVLVDLTMHMSHNRLPVFARKPAPVQVAWLAYPGSTGLATMDYRLTDAHIDPPEIETPYYSEQSVHLPDCWCCYHPLTDEPPVTPLPATSAAGITFGCLNNFCKINEQTLALFARVLRTVDGSRLVLLAPEGSPRQRILDLFNQDGVPRDRIEFVGAIPRPDYLKYYQRIDIALDPLPYNGITTTCDAFWMGVPVVSLAGKTAAGRAGLSLLATIGLPELATGSPEEFVQAAKELASNRPRLAKWREELRPRMEASPLMDGPRFARNIEAAYRTMWRRWCADPPSAHV